MSESNSINPTLLAIINDLEEADGPPNPHECDYIAGLLSEKEAAELEACFIDDPEYLAELRQQKDEMAVMNEPHKLEALGARLQKEWDEMLLASQLEIFTRAELQADLPLAAEVPFPMIRSDDGKFVVQAVQEKSNLYISVTCRVDHIEAPDIEFLIGESSRVVSLEKIESGWFEARIVLTADERRSLPKNTLIKARLI
jgi:hypothetical protein